MYLNRPVFPLQISHAQPWKGSFSFDLRTKQVGFGAAQHLSEQVHQVRRLDVQVWLDNGRGLLDLETFFEQVRGRSVGFWLPLSHQSMTLLEVVDETTIRVAGTEDAERWNLTPRIHLALIEAQTYRCEPRAIASAQADGSDTLVQLDSAVAGLDPQAWSVSLLPYVRLGSDEVEVSSDGVVLTATFPCVELPLEYEAAGADTTRIKLYELGYRVAGKSAWQRVTSFGVQVSGSDGTNWTPRPIEHGEINEDSSGARTTIRALDWEGCPLLDLLPWSKGLPLSIRIYETAWDWAAFRATGEPRLLFDGQVKKPSRQGREIAASCQSGIDLYNRQVPSRVFSRQCQAAFCDAACGLNRADFELEATAGPQTVGSGYFIDVSCPSLAALGGANWLALGSIYSSAWRNNEPSREWESRPILGVTDLGSGNWRLQIRDPFRWMQEGATCYLFNGCPRSTTACKTRRKVDGTVVDNYVNFWGHPMVPLKNPESNMAIDTSTSGKKSK